MSLKRYPLKHSYTIAECQDESESFEPSKAIEESGEVETGSLSIASGDISLIDFSLTRAPNFGCHHYVIPAEKSGAFHVWVQDNVEDVHKKEDSKCVFLTCHDIGKNHYSFRMFLWNTTPLKWNDVSCDDKNKFLCKKTK